MNVRESDNLTDIMSSLRRDIYDTVNFKYHFSRRLRSIFDTYDIDMRCDPMGGFIVTCSGRLVDSVYKNGLDHPMNGLTFTVSSLLSSSITSAAKELNYILPRNFESLVFGIFNVSKIKDDSIIIRI